MGEEVTLIDITIIDCVVALLSSQVSRSLCLNFRRMLCLNVLMNVGFKPKFCVLAKKKVGREASYVCKH